MKSGAVAPLLSCRNFGYSVIFLIKLYAIEIRTAKGILKIIYFRALSLLTKSGF